MAAWSNEQKRRLVELWNQTDPVISTRLIGTMMEISHNSVISQARRQPECKPRGSPIKGPVANPHIKRAGKVTLPDKFGKIAQAAATGVHPQTQDVVTFEDWTRIPHTPKRERLPIPIGAVGRAATCQWPTTTGRPWHFCGATSQAGYSWCPAHKERAFVTRQAFAA